MIPLLKWPGGKRNLVPTILEYMPDKFDAYYEPFAGGLALMFELQPLDAWVCDTNSSLINFYTVVMEHIEWLIQQLDVMYYDISDREEFYYAQRKRFNILRKSDCCEGLLPAALMYFLNKTCFNGLWRVNESGEFNVSVGDKDFKVNKEALISANHYLQTNSVKLVNDSFTSIAEYWPNSGDFVYLDPPYHKAGVKYTSKDFTEDDQRELALLFKHLECPAILSNSDTPYIRELYQDFKIVDVVTDNRISCKGSTRANAKKEVLVIK